MNDHDTLIWVQNAVEDLKKLMTNHLAHHAKAVNRIWFVIGGLLMLLGQSGIALLIWSISR